MPASKTDPFAPPLPAHPPPVPGCVRACVVMIGVVLAAAGPPPAWAQQAVTRTAADERGVVSFALENDLFAGEDNGYTNGVRLSYLSPEADIPDWLERGARAFPLFADGGRRRYGFAVGQSMYAPDDLRSSDLITTDRPYAGFLYTSVGVLSDTGVRLDNLQLTVGVVGPSALAAETQDFVHSVVGSPDPQGWDHQLRDEPGLALTYERKWRGIHQFEPFGLGVDVTPHLGASLGNVQTHLSAGATLRLGYDLPADYGPPLIRPNLPGSDFFVPHGLLGWYVFAGFEGRAVGRNIFLDGNTFRASHSVEKKAFIGGLQAGVAVTLGNVRLAYTHVLRSEEFVGQKSADTFGAFTISLRY